MSLCGAKSDDDSQDPSRMNGGLINRLALVEAFREPKIGSGEIKPTTWPRRYVRRMQLSLGAGDRSPPQVALCVPAALRPWIAP